MIKETFGVNSIINLFYKKSKELVYKSQKLGSSSILFYKVKKLEEYIIEIEYSHSIIEFSNFFSCPHLNIKFSMISDTDFKEHF